jgi:hypothetical protein
LASSLRRVGITLFRHFPQNPKGASKLKIGEKVTIYEDPVTCKRPEGKATLVRLVKPSQPSDEPKLEHWEVQFDAEIGDTYIRVIKVP